jgi:long-chain acyl-CoA synthetase
MSLRIDSNALDLVIRDLVHAELRRHAPGRFGKLKRSSIRIDQQLEETIAGFDSLDLIRCANAVASFFNLHDAGVEDLLLTNSSVAGFSTLIQQFRSGSHSAIDEAVKDFTFTTSGSTGKPAFWKHEETWLAQEVAFWVKNLQLQAPSRTRVVACVPQCHLYGFIWSVLLPTAMGLPVLILTPEQLLPSKLNAGDLVIANPSIWKAWSELDATWANDVVGISSTAPFDAQVSKSLKSRNISVIDVYGSTENAGIAWRFTEESAYQLIDHYHFELQNEDTTTEPTRLIRLCPDGLHRAYPVLDRLALTNLREFSVLGRKDNVTQVNGFNVSIDWVVGGLAQQTNVTHCAVRKMTAAEGDYLKVFIATEVKTDIGALEQELTRWSSQNLPDPARPRHWSFGTALPRNEMGKLCDWSIEVPELQF